MPAFKALTLLFLSLFVLSCTKKDPAKPEVWIYTSLYKDTIADIQPQLEKEFPNVKFQFFQAGSEEIATKVNAEILAGGTKADVVICSDRFWYEDMAQQGRLHSFKNKSWDKIDVNFKNAEGLYATVSYPVMVLIYNSEVIPENEAPKTFKELADPKWKGKFATGSPLASGTNFTTVAFLSEAYGWDYFKSLRKNETISEGGNSAVIRRVQSKERPIGWVLLENALRLVKEDPRLKIIYPQDGSVLQSNVLAIIKKESTREHAEKFVEWMYAKSGQEAMTKSFMYAAIPEYASPEGALAWSELYKNARPWNSELLAKFTNEREKIKEQFTKVMFE